MSTSAGSIPKSEKGKTKFPSLDINSLYKGPETEPAQQKGTVPRKNGMQSLGKVPPARRPPANLPSLKAESSGTETAVSLVPSGSGGWGAKPGEAPPPTQPNVLVANTGSGPPPPAVVVPQVLPTPQHDATALRGPLPTSADKSWKAVAMGDQNPKHFTQQSPQFQQEFPKLEGGVPGQQQPKNVDAQYGPGPSLRPQTVGSWTGGGGRPQAGGPGAPAAQSLGPGLHMGPGPEPVAPRTNLGPHAVAGVPTGQAGLANPPLASYTPIIPFGARIGAFPANMANMPGPRYQAPNYMMPARPTPVVDGDDTVRPIIKEEELSKLDEISRNPGWAAHQDIDYNKQLSFSDNEESPNDPNKRIDRKDKEDKNRGKEEEKDRSDRSSEDRSVDWDRSRQDRVGYPVNSLGRPVDEEVLKVKEQVAVACERSRQIRDDEAKRFDETRAGNKKFSPQEEKAETGPSLFPDFTDRSRPGDVADERLRQGGRDNRGNRNDREVNDREEQDSKPDHKYERDNKYDREHKHGRDGRYGGQRGHGHPSNLPPRLRPRNDRPNNAMRGTGSPQSVPVVPPSNNFVDGQWNNRRFGGEPEIPVDKRENEWAGHRERPPPDNFGERFKNGTRDRAYPHPPYSEPVDHRRHFDRKDREEPDEREGSYKKGWSEPQRDRKEPSEEREAWRAGEPRPNSRDGRTSRPDNREVDPRNQPQRPDSRDSDMKCHPQRPDSRDPQRPDSRDSRMSREDEKDRRQQWEIENHGQLLRPDIRDNDNRGQPPRPESRDVDSRQPQRPDSRDSRISREDEKDSKHQRPQRPDSRDSRTSRESRTSRDEKENDHKGGGGRFGSNQLKDDKQRDEKEKKEPSNRHGSGSGHGQRDKQSDRGQKKQPRPALTQLRSEENEIETSNRQNEDKLDMKEPMGKGEAIEEKDEKGLLDGTKQKGGKSLRGGRGPGAGAGPGWPGNPTFVRGGMGRPDRRRRTSDRLSGNRGVQELEPESASSGEGGSEIGKGEKEERNREMQTGGGRDGFAPSGQPSRRGRGAMRARGVTSASHRMYGYGPPPGKAPFAQPEPTTPEEEEDPTKQKQAALNAGIASGANRSTGGQQKALPSRNQRPQNRESNKGKQNRGPRRKPNEGEEGDEVLSNSEGEDKKGDVRPPRRNQNSRPRTGPQRTSNTGGGSGSMGKPSTGVETKEESKPKLTDADADTNAIPQSNNQDKSLDKKKNGKEPYRGAPKNEAGGRSVKEKRGDRDRGGKPIISSTNPSGPQPLMSQVVTLPTTMCKNNWRTQLPPRLVKQQQLQQQQQQNLQQPQQQDHQQAQQPTDVHDLNKLSSSMGMFSSKGDAHQTGINAWGKSLGPGPGSGPEQGPPEGSSQRSSPAGKLPVRGGDQLLEDSAAPVKTIIFENTNYKATGPSKFSSHLKHQPPHVEKENERKSGEETSGVMSAFDKSSELHTEFLDADAAMKLSLYRPDQNNIMDFNFNAEIGEMTITNKLAKTKSLWEAAPDQGEDDQPGGGVFPGGFCPDPTVDAAAFGKPVDGNVVVPDDCGIMHSAEVAYSSPPQMPVINLNKQDPTTSSNVCKVKPQQQTVIPSGHSPLGQQSISPPPFSSAQPGPFNYPQAGLGGSTASFGGMPAIPSPPAMMSYSSQQLQQGSGLFPAFQVEQARMSQYSATPYGSLGGTSAYNQSLYLQHPAPPSTDIYSSQFRLQHPTPPFGQSQLSNNPNAVLLTSSTSSLMSASVKSSSQSIGAIGSKGTAYQQNSQVFIPVDPMQLGLNQNFMPNSGMVQRAAPVPPTPPNFYSNSTGPQGGFFGNPGSTLGQPGPTAPQLQPGYGLQGFGNQSSTLGLQSFSSQIGFQAYRTPSAVGPAPYLKSSVSSNSSSQQDAMASVFSAMPQIPSPKTRPSKQMNQPLQQQMNQPLPQQSPTQPPSNKYGSYPSLMSQQQGNQQRVTSGGVGLQGMRSGGSNANRYPSPIQRPAASRNRPSPHQRPTSKAYFEGQDGNIKLEETNDLNKPDDASQLNCDSKLSDGVTASKVELVEDNPSSAATD